MGNISTQIKEEQEFVLDPEWGISAYAGGLSKSERTIAQDNYDIEKEETM